MGPIARAISPSRSRSVLLLAGLSAAGAIVASSVVPRQAVAIVAGSVAAPVAGSGSAPVAGSGATRVAGSGVTPVAGSGVPLGYISVTGFAKSVSNTGLTLHILGSPQGGAGQDVQVTYNPSRVTVTDGRNAMEVPALAAPPAGSADPAGSPPPTIRPSAIQPDDHLIVDGYQQTPHGSISASDIVLTFPPLPSLIPPGDADIAGVVKAVRPDVLTLHLDPAQGYSTLDVQVAYDPSHIMALGVPRGLPASGPVPTPSPPTTPPSTIQVGDSVTLTGTWKPDGSVSANVVQLLVPPPPPGPNAAR